MTEIVVMPRLTQSQKSKVLHQIYEAMRFSEMRVGEPAKRTTNNGDFTPPEPPPMAA